ncbi:PREDICTED: uncharacterized protein LOC105965758 [Erythranthe guttata]|uniref:uncharacterized protein LOC105965758 n=1 Tax=Erythranthe guttata TaxID=4155 RepID=UPI00064DF208|nr:PREDICTED: uncharacterized protein LOC105965758 [Erythranthe guttata]|eukprot:XP_012845775.1 PREDICTED: uncharacterized protein LOC105965758 [Erythranthe guttata]
MAALKKNIAILLRQDWRSFSIPTVLLNFGLTLLALRLTSSTVCPHHSSNENDYNTGPQLSHSDTPEITPELPMVDQNVVGPVASHPMLTRAKAGIYKPRHPAYMGLVHSYGLLSVLLTSTEPKGFKFAAENPAWLAAMDEEVQALKNNCTWILVSRPTNTDIVGSKWVFRTKYFADGSLERLKARLVANGYTQVPEIDYTDTFSPVIKATTVRVVLSLVVSHRCPIRQLDLKNAFLNGHLTEHVYMEQPPGYIDPRFPNHVCQLKKAIYGLKQAPRAWFQLLGSFLIQLGFYCSRADTSLDILTRAQLLDSKPVPTPMVVSQHLSFDGPYFSDPTLYRSLVGALQYLTITRPDIAHAVNSMQIGQDARILVVLLLVTLFILAVIWSRGVPKNSPQFLALVVNLNIAL